jgi:hypothetical protein
MTSFNINSLNLSPISSSKTSQANVSSVFALSHCPLFRLPLTHFHSYYQDKENNGKSPHKSTAKKVSGVWGIGRGAGKGNRGKHFFLRFSNSLFRPGKNKH